MKSFLFPVLVVGVGVSACGVGKETAVLNESSRSDVKEFKTLVTCQQDEGDQYKSIGIIDSKEHNGLVAVIVENNVDDDSATLVRSIAVEDFFTWKDGKSFASLVDGDNVLSLEGQKVEGEGFKGELWPLPAMGIEGVEGMVCFRDTEISFAGEIKIEKKVVNPTTTVKTEMTCRQEDGDQVRSVGIVQRDGGLVALVVDQNFDVPEGESSTRKLALTVGVNVNDDAPNSTEWFRKRGPAFFKLVVAENSRGQLVGELSTDENSESLSGLECQPDSDLTFDSETSAAN